MKLWKVFDYTDNFKNLPIHAYGFFLVIRGDKVFVYKYI
jgi:hypothetical protein